MTEVLYQVKKLIFKRWQRKHWSSQLNYFPTKVAIETGNICNLDCPLCPTGNEKEKVKKGMLSFENYVNILDQLGPYAHHLDLFNWGEPLLNKDIVKMVKYAKDKFRHLKVIISSNLNILPDEMAEGLVLAGLDKMIVSADGATQETYVQYRVGGNLDTVLVNMNKLVQAKVKHEKTTPQIVWNFLVFKHNMHEVDLVKKRAAEMGVDVNVAGMRTDCAQEIYKPLEERMKEDAEWIPVGSEYNKYTPEELTHRETRCPKPWYTVTINWDGSVVPCGSVYDTQKYAYGNMLKEPFEKIWNNEKYREARLEIAGKPNAGLDVICRTCKKNGYPLYN